MKVKREDEFGPVKNADGVDSPQSARELLYAQANRWLKQIIPDFESHSPLEIDTLLSYEGEGLEAFRNLDISHH
jgi:hypothetical protein